MFSNTEHLYGFQLAQFLSLELLKIQNLRTKNYLT